MPIVEYWGIIKRFFASNRPRAQMRFRSSERDSATDSIRLDKIERSVNKAIAEAEAEKIGIERRLGDARARASLLMGNDSSGYEDRDKNAEQRLTEFERQLVAAAQRMRQLDTHLEHLSQVLESLKVN